MDNITVNVGNYVLSVNDKVYVTGDKLFHLMQESLYTMRLSGKDLDFSGKLMVYKSERVSSLFIDIEKGSKEKIKKDKSAKLPADILAVDINGIVSYKDSLKYITGHGNATFHTAKKPYEFKTSGNAQILGIDGNDKWVLLANAYDVAGDYRNAIEELDKAIAMTELNNSYKRYRAELVSRIR